MMIDVVYFISLQLNHILHNVPEKKQQNKMALDQQKKKLDKVAALAPVKANVS